MMWLALADPARPLTPHNLWAAWNFEPSLLILLGLTALIYIYGLHNAARPLPVRQWAAFTGAMLSLVLALVSPLDSLSGVLFSAHMVQHLILILIAAPLLVLSELPLATVWALPRRWAQALGHGLSRSRAWQVLTSPVSAWLLFAIQLWVWHASTLFEAALHNETIHTFEHLGFVLTGMLFWWTLFKHTASDHLHYGMAIPYLFTTTVHSTLLGALMTFASWPWYATYASRSASWGQTPLQDQQLAGLIMWIPGGLVFTLLTIGYFAAWFRALVRRSVRLQRRDQPVKPQERG